MNPATGPVYVLGTGLSHDGSACLLKDGRVCVAIEKERLTRVKHDGGNDTFVIQYCLDAAGIALADLSLIVQNANFGMFERGNDWFRGTRIIPSDIPVVTISHHLAHAFSAFGASPFEESAVLVVDGCGNGLDECMDLDDAIVPERSPKDLAHLHFEKDSYYLLGRGRRRSLYKDFSPWGMHLKEYAMCPSSTYHSIGGLYAAVSVYAFAGIDDSGKLMGLAPYGRAGIHDFEIFDLREGRVFVRYEWMKYFNQPASRPEDFKAHFQHYADLALHVQKEVERALIYLVRSRYEMFPHSNLCYSGGVALNAVANRRILKECPFQNLFIQPAAGDNGLALGAAYYGWLEVLKKDKVLHDGSSRFGKLYPGSAIESALARFSSRLHVQTSKNVADETAYFLASGNVVGWFQGRSEFGPRALGGRSILADPRSPTVRDYINKSIKFREDFRPFAPSVPLEDVNTYFECDYPSPYMLLVSTVRPEWAHLIPSVVHLDRTARIQTVTQADDPLYYQLLTALKKRTGISVLLNTSFNKRAMPIVETPEQAIDFFLSYGLDLLVLGSYIIQKKRATATVPPTAPVLFDRFHQVLKKKRMAAMQLGTTFQFNISSPQSWTIDLGPEGPHVKQGPAKAPDVTIDCQESALMALLESPSNLNSLMREGKLRVTGEHFRVAELFRLLNVP